MLSAAEAHKLSNVGFDVNIKLDLIEKAIRETAAEGKYALWYCFRAKNEFFVEKIQKRLEAAGYKVDPFYEKEEYRLYINWRDASEE